VKKVIVIDDSRVVRQQVRAALAELPIEIIEAADGQEGEAAVRAALTTAPPSLVICDVNMPLVSGIMLLRNLKSDAATAGVPVLMLTTEGHPDLVREARQLGAVGWLVKPFKPNLLVEAVKKLAKLGESTP